MGSVSRTRKSYFQILKTLADVLFRPLCAITEKSFSKAQVSEGGEVAPVFKGGGWVQAIMGQPVITGAFVMARFV